MEEYTVRLSWRVKLEKTIKLRAEDEDELDKLIDREIESGNHFWVSDDDGEDYGDWDADIESSRHIPDTSYTPSVDQEELFPLPFGHPMELAKSLQN